MGKLWGNRGETFFPTVAGYLLSGVPDPGSGPRAARGLMPTPATAESATPQISWRRSFAATQRNSQPASDIWTFVEKNTTFSEELF